MVRLFAQFQVCFLIWSGLTCLTVASRTVEERLKSLEDKVGQIQNLQTNFNKMRTVLEDHTKRMVLLEKEIQQLKSTVTELTKEPKEDVGIAPINSFRAQGVGLIYRTCHEIQTKDPSLPSGMYKIDPDGQGIGDDPILVYCDMTTGTSSIWHDSESKTNVGNCVNPGCYSKPINYSATKRQMTTLVNLSDKCHQSFKYDCNNAPFEIGDISYSWWNDRNGNPQYFWAGSNSSVHTCQCGINRKCLESAKKCNCDSSLPIPKSDSGLITNKGLLPITRLNFGRTLLETSSGVYTLGRFECSGQIPVNGMASSCSDLWRIGHTLSGFYSVKGAEMMESVYCNFSKLPSEAGFQNRLGFLDVKSSPIYFYVQKTTTFNVLNTPIPFEVERLNIGRAMNLTSGIFTAPRTGIYFFTFSGTVFVQLECNNCFVRVCFYFNDNCLGKSLVHQAVKFGYFTMSLQSTLSLKPGDQVSLKIHSMMNAYFYADDNSYTHFTGQLVQEILL